MRIVIITSARDAHVSFVTNHFASTTEVVCIDPYGDIGHQGKDISYGFDGHALRTFYGDKLLGKVDSVWFRKPTPLHVDKLGIDPKFGLYTESALLHHMSVILYHWDAALWVSKTEAIARAKQKPHQLEAAMSLGFNVPPTLTTANETLARQFVEKQKQCVVKTLATVFPQDKYLMTRVITHTGTFDYSGLSVDPMIFQRYIEPAYELRVTVVGETVFAAKVGGKDIGKDSFRDWRHAHINHTFYAEATTLDRKTAQACIALTKKFGLNFGVIDLIADADNKLWFLEINPNGQWGFIEEHTGQPIGAALAALLEHRTKT